MTTASRLLAAVVACLAFAVPAHADSWVPPTITTYTSSNKDIRLTVIPRGLESPLAFFEDKAEARESAGAPTGEAARGATAVMERQVGGRWMTLWRAPLVNEVAPVSALVGDDDRHVVTFDNWHSIGLGEHVVVIYGESGRLIRSLRLDEILPARHLAALTRSISSLQWSGRHRFAPDGRRLLLAVVVPDKEEAQADRADKVEVAIELATGMVLPLSGAEWDQASARAEHIARARNAVARDGSSDGDPGRSSRGPAYESANARADDLEKIADELEAEADALENELSKSQSPRP